MKIKINYDSVACVTREANPNDEWDRDDTSTDHSIYGFRVVDDDEYFDVITTIEPEFGKQYYLVYVIYSTGDSFGNDESACIEFVALYETESLAQDVVDDLKKQYRDGIDSVYYGNYIYLPAEGTNGKVMKYSTNAWHGYFENPEEFAYIAIYRGTE